MPVGKTQQIKAMCEEFSESDDLLCEMERRKDQPAASTGADQAGESSSKATTFTS